MIITILLLLANIIFIPFYSYNRPIATGLPPNGNKLGLTGNNLTMQQTLGASWAYSWIPNMNPDIPESVPMIAHQFTELPDISGSSVWVMGANEPDIQVVVSPADYVPMWHAIEEAYGNTHLLVSPAQSHDNLWWLPEFREKYKAAYGYYPHFDALAVHCYGYADTCIDIVKKNIAWAKEWGTKEVWVTEFGFYHIWETSVFKYPSAEAEAKKFIAYLEAEPMVTRYAPFVSTQGNPADCHEVWWWFPRECSEDSSLIQWNDYNKLTEYGLWYSKGLK